MEMEPVSSSNIAAIGYDSRNRYLYVQFNSGSTWRYHDVESFVYDDFMSAGSKGSYFYYNIRDLYYGDEV